MLKVERRKEKMKWLDRWGKKYRKKYRIADDSPYSNLDFLIQEIIYPIVDVPFWIWHRYILRDMY